VNPDLDHFRTTYKVPGNSQTTERIERTEHERR
jgi:hypothetical protein